MSQTRSRPLLLIVVVLSVAPYLPALGNPFWGEDYLWIYRSIAALRQPSLPFTSVFQRDYNPVAYLVFVANFAASGMRPWAWHAVDMGIHAACAALVFQLANLLCASPLTAAACGLLFGIHAAISEPVVWSGARFHSEATLCVLGAALCLFAPRASARRIGLPLLWLLGLGVKETAIGFALLPPAFLAWSLLRQERRIDRLAAWFPLALAALYAVARALLLPSTYARRALLSLDPWTVLVKSSLTILSFLGIEGRLPENAMTVLFPPFLLVALLLLTRDRVLAFGAIWTLALTAAHLPLPFHSSRYCYLPWPGLCLIAARAGQRALALTRSRLPSMAAALLLASWGIANALQIQVEIRDYRRLGTLANAELLAFAPIAARLESLASANARLPVVLVDASSIEPLRAAIAALEGRPKLVRPKPEAVAGLIPIPELLNILFHRSGRVWFEPVPEPPYSPRVLVITYQGQGRFAEAWIDGTGPELGTVAASRGRITAGFLVPHR